MKALTLLGGYTDAQKTLHRDVEVGYVLRGTDLFALDDHPLNDGPTYRDFLILSKAITKFGTLKMPVAVSVLIALDSIDRDDLLDAYNALDSEAREGRVPKVLSDTTLQLARGCEIEGVIYDEVEFGFRLTGRDFIEADHLELAGARRACFLAGRQVKQLSQSTGGAALPGPIDLDVFEKLSVADITGIQGAAELYRQSFRRPRTEVQGERDEKDSLHADGGDRANA